ncbi:MAG: hypothetical protein EZS28_024321 [Streblomastix strix]|uniref:Reverse transcriptase domain-containing protein n=1 Tax=Streblomastix strix TaxID=222440 RepID=A0A5J4VC98_9EUKA|nr:MAG: hypothetical protein EZS28_024321 [Streblomastix strix]
MKTEIRIKNFVDDIILLHKNKMFLKKITQKVIETLKYFGFTINTEQSETEPKQTEIFLGLEQNLNNATVKTKPKMRILFLHDLYNMRRWIKTGTEITVKQTAQLTGKPNKLSLQFQEASLFMNAIDHQKTQAARLRGWFTTIIMNKTAISDINYQIIKLRANIPIQFIQIPPQATMATDAAPGGQGQILEKELEMIAIAHTTWKLRQAKLTSDNMEIKAITQGLRSFSKVSKNSRIQSLQIRSDINTAVFDIIKWSTISTLIKEIQYPRFMPTIRGHGELAVDALKQLWKKEFPWIHPPFRLLPAVLKKIREEQIEAMIIVPLWPGQI